MVNYGNGKVYKIVSDETDKIYVGSTTKKYLSQRMDSHRADYKRFKNGQGDNIKSFEILKYEDAKIILLESFPCKSKDELLAREQYYIELYKDVVANKNNALGRDQEKRKATNRAYDKKRWKNDPKRREYQKIKHICECGGHYVSNTKARHNKSVKHQSYINDPEYIPNKSLF